MSTVLQIRIDKDTKESAEFVLKSVGLDLSTAIRMFLIKVIRTGGIPFEPVIETPVDPKHLAKTIAEMQKESEEKGLDKLTLDEINDIIAEVRKERKSKK